MPERPRRRLSRDQRVDQIVAATLAVVARVGYGQASTAAIATEAGIAKGLVFHYFDDADDVMRTTVLRTAARLRDAVASELDLTRPVPEVVRAALDRAARLCRTHAPDLRAVNAIVSGLRDADGASLVADGHDETHALERRLFARGVEQGSIRAVDLHLLARTYQAAIDAMVDHLLDHPDVEPTAYAASLADLLLGGIASP